jgi:phosphatidylglycerol lysyltransferase
MPAARGWWDRTMDVGTIVVPAITATLNAIAAFALLVGLVVPHVAARKGVSALFPSNLTGVATVLIGVVSGALLFLAPAVQRRRQVAFWFSFTLIAAGVALALHLRWGLVISITLACLVPVYLTYRREFFRRAPFLEPTLTRGWTVTAFCIFVSMGWLLVVSHHSYGVLRSFVAGKATLIGIPQSMWGLIAAAVTFLLLAMLAMLRPRWRRKAAAPNDDAVSRAVAIAQVQRQPEALGVLWDSRQILFSASDEAFLAFAYAGRSAVAFGDPAGPVMDCRELIWAFRELCDRARIRPAFWRVGSAYRTSYLDVGLRLTPIAEQARLDLGRFTLRGPARARLRQALSQGVQLGMTLHMLHPGEALQVANELTTISNSTHPGQTSTVTPPFCPDSIGHVTVAACLLDERIVAFATLLMTEQPAVAVIDFLGYRPDVPSVTVEFMLTGLVLELQHLGLATLTLGQVALDADDPLRPRFATFDPVWLPLYLAHPRSVEAESALADVAATWDFGRR